MEIWKDIHWLKGKYQVSNLGNVRSLDREVRFKDGRIAHFKGKHMKLRKNADGYLQVQLCPDSFTTKTVRVHRLVAEAFIPNPKGYKEVNHIDENKENNSVANLEWSNRIQNCNHGTRNKRISVAHGTPVFIHSEKEALRFQSMTETARYLGVAPESVRCALRNGYRCRGYEVSICR